MASVFKASCALYWLIWIFCLSWALGMSLYEVSFVHHANPPYHAATLLAKILCYVLSFYCVVGCIFVKCDISHIICVACYTIPMLIVVPGFCIFGITHLEKDSLSHFFLTPDILLNKSTEFYRKHNRVPIWLERAENVSTCCGIHSYRDYQLFFYPAFGQWPPEIDINETRDENGQLGPPVFVDDPDLKLQITPKKIPQEVPARCCAYFRHGRKIIGAAPAQHCFTNLTSKFSVLRGENESTSGDRILLNPEHLDAYRVEKEKPHFPYRRNHSMSNPHVNVSIHGCAPFIIEQSMAAVNMNYYVFPILLASSLVMSIVYLKSWFAGRRFLGGHSDHSLDVEDMSLVDIQKKPSHEDLSSASNTQIHHSVSVPRYSVAVPGQPVVPGSRPPPGSISPRRQSVASLRRGTLH